MAYDIAKAPQTVASQITPSTTVKSTLETLANAVSELQKTFEELANRVGPVLECLPTCDQSQEAPTPARLSPGACGLACAIDSDAERIEKLAGRMYRLTQQIQL